jgi:hypothetical protein
MAKELLDELEGSYLEVCKVPSRLGGYIRVPVSVNAGIGLDGVYVGRLMDFLEKW